MENNRGQLNYPLDSQSEKAIEKSFDKFFNDKIADYIWNRTFYYATSFDSLDGLGSSNASISEFGVSLVSPNATTSAFVEKGLYNNYLASGQQAFNVNFQKSQFLRTQLRFVDTGSAKITISAGQSPLFGFKSLGGVIQGFVYDVNSGTIKTKNLYTLLPQGFVETVELDARYYPTNRCVFLVNGVEKGSLAFFPSQSQSSAFFYQMILTGSDNGGALVDILHLAYLQKL